MPVLHDRNWTGLNDALRRAMATHVPEWTAGNESDPSVTVLEVCAFLMDALAERSRPAPDHAAPLLARIHDALTRLEDGAPLCVRVNGERWTFVADLEEAAPDASVFSLNPDGTVIFGDGRHGRRPPDGSRVAVGYRDGAGQAGSTSIAIRSEWPLPDRVYTVTTASAGTLRFDRTRVDAVHWAGLKRPRYFSGQMLTSDDFTTEQEYFLRKHRRHQIGLHGAGIVSGLEVVVDNGRGNVRVGEGLAVDGNGRDIDVSCGGTIDLPKAAVPPLYVMVEYAERETDRVASLSGGGTEASRIEEGSRIRLTNEENCSTGVSIARLILGDNGWTVDVSYRPPRLR